jgi:hypothetical protein
MTQAAGRNVVCTNHSYGFLRGWNQNDSGTWEWWGSPAQSETEDYLYGKYTGAAVEVDKLVCANQKLSVFVAAGNERGAEPNDPTANNPGFDGTHRLMPSELVVKQKRPGDQAVNGGYDTLEGRGLAKNVITVGAIVHPAEASSTQRCCCHLLFQLGPARRWPDQTRRCW